jgi:tagaturonate reductase
MGLGNVLDCMKSETLKNAIFALNELEVLPCVPLPREESSQYFSTVLDRFANPYLDHRLLNIALSSVAKWKSRLMPSLLDYYAKKGSVPKLLSFSLAALTYCYSTGANVQDDAFAVAFFRSIADKAKSDPKSCAEEIILESTLFGDALLKVEGLSDCLASEIADIFALGMEKALLKATEEARAKEGK